MIVVSSIVVIIVELFNFYDNSHFIPSNDSFVMNGEVVRRTNNIDSTLNVFPQGV